MQNDPIGMDGSWAMKGGCLCGAVRYAISGHVIESGICHCKTCCRIASVPGLPFMSIQSADFRFIRAEPVDYASSPGVTRSFCGHCGSPLTYRHDDALGALDVMTLSLDEPDAVPPHFQIRTSEAVEWDQRSGNLQAYPRARQ